MSREPWRTALDQALAAAPEPAAAASLAEKVLAAASSERLAEADPQGLADVLSALCGTAPFLAPWLLRHPDWLFELALPTADTAGELAARGRELSAALERAEGADADALLREFKYRELAGISVRDCAPARRDLEHSGETLDEISRLADLLLEAALRVAWRRLVPAGSAPTGAAAAGFVVLGLGKLGGEELNYSSDVDLIYVHAGGAAQRSAFDYSRLAQEFGRLVAARTADGFLYRVDLDLRPEGGQGPLVISEQALGGYYESAADTWEKVAWMKARPVAGDLALGWRVIRAVAPMIYQASMDYEAVRRIRSLKDRIGAERASAAAGFDVKTDPGGIRDIEFAAQALQLLHGGRIPQLRGRSTRRALTALAEVGLVPEPAVASLQRSYLFLRRVENRLQMWAERQTHRVPGEGPELTRLARSLGFVDAAADEGLLTALAEERRRVGDFTRSFLSDRGAEAIQDLFARHQPELLAMPATRPMLENLAEQFAAAIEASADPERALDNLDRFIDGVGPRRFYYELLLDRPELVPRLAALFAASRFLSGYLASHPRLIEPVFDHPDRLLLSRAELQADLQSIRAQLGDEDGDALEQGLDALRLFHHRQVLNVGLLDVGERVERRATEVALSELAEVTLEEALVLAAGEQERSLPRPEAAQQGAFVVIGMGKLASQELSYGSDLDLIFLYDVPAAEPSDIAEAQAWFARLAQRLISAIQTPTREGRCYEIDARLRPSGRQGTLVTSLAAFRRYHDGEAQAWERQALLRARAVAGDEALARAFGVLRLEILRRPPPEGLAEEIHHIRLRMERELAGETRERRDLKTGRGGLLDVENAVQYLQLLHGAKHEALLAAEAVESQVARLESLGLLEPARARVLAQGWDFLQRLGSQLRIVENRSISDLDARRGDLDAVARRLGYAAGGRESSARRALLRDYARHTEAVRAAYLEILAVQEADPAPV